MPRTRFVKKKKVDFLNKDVFQKPKQRLGHKKLKPANATVPVIKKGRLAVAGYDADVKAEQRAARIASGWGVIHGYLASPTPPKREVILSKLGQVLKLQNQDDKILAHIPTVVLPQLNMGITHYVQVVRRAAERVLRGFLERHWAALIGVEASKGTSVVGSRPFQTLTNNIMLHVCSNLQNPNESPTDILLSLVLVLLRVYPTLWSSFSIPPVTYEGFYEGIKSEDELVKSEDAISFSELSPLSVMPNARHATELDWKDAGGKLLSTLIDQYTQLKLSLLGKRDAATSLRMNRATMLSRMHYMVYMMAVMTESVCLQPTGASQLVAVSLLERANQTTGKKKDRIEELTFMNKALVSKLRSVLLKEGEFLLDDRAQEFEQAMDSSDEEGEEEAHGTPVYAVADLWKGPRGTPSMAPRKKKKKAAHDPFPQPTPGATLAINSLLCYISCLIGTKQAARPLLVPSNDYQSITSPILNEGTPGESIDLNFQTKAPFFVRSAVGWAVGSLEEEDGGEIDLSPSAVPTASSRFCLSDISRQRVEVSERRGEAGAGPGAGEGEGEAGGTLHEGEEEMAESDSAVVPLAEEGGGGSGSESSEISDFSDMDLEEGESEPGAGGPGGSDEGVTEREGAPPPIDVGLVLRRSLEVILPQLDQKSQAYVLRRIGQRPRN